MAQSLMIKRLMILLPKKKQYGENYQRVLSQAGMTLETRKAQIRTSKLVELAVKKVAEAELTDEAYKKAFDEYTPDVTAQIIRLNNEDKAKEVLEKAKAEGADFAQLAKDNSTDEKQKKMVEKLPLILLQQKYLSKSKKPLSL